MAWGKRLSPILDRQPHLNDETLAEAARPASAASRAAEDN
jgi:hypothetical protein